jgi:hypothetical protein
MPIRAQFRTLYPKNWAVLVGPGRGWIGRFAAAGKLEVWAGCVRHQACRHLRI